MVNKDEKEQVGDTKLEIGMELTKHPGTSSKLRTWDPENEQFWMQYGKKIAWKNLLVSIPNLCLMFATWIIWSYIAVILDKAHTADPDAYSFSDYVSDPSDPKQYKSAIFILPTVAGLAGATLRIPNSFMTKVTGGRMHNAMTSLLCAIPMFLTALTLMNADCSFAVLIILAALSGFGGGAFASSMNNISTFFPKKESGTSLGLNAGIGNLGVSLTQLIVPGFSAVPIGGVIGGFYLWNAGFLYSILLIICGTLALIYMNYMPEHGSTNGSSLYNMKMYMRLEFIGFIGVVFTTLIVILFPTKLPGLTILRVFLLAPSACLLTLVCMWYLSGDVIQKQLGEQAVIFKDKHTWWMTYLYIMTFGSFIGYSNSFPLLISTVFGKLPDGSVNPNAPSVASYAWMGAFLGSIARPIGGYLSDKYSGSAVTHWGTIIQIIATVLVGIFVRLAMSSETPEEYFPYFLICFLFLFTATGSSNGSTFKQMSAVFPSEQVGPVLGWTSAVAAYGAAIFPACFGAGNSGGFVDVVLYVFAFYYLTCLGVNYYFYYRKNAEKPC